MKRAIIISLVILLVASAGCISNNNSKQQEPIYAPHNVTYFTGTIHGGFFSINEKYDGESYLMIATIHGNTITVMIHDSYYTSIRDKNVTLSGPGVLPKTYNMYPTANYYSTIVLHNNTYTEYVTTLENSPIMLMFSYTGGTIVDIYTLYDGSAKSIGAITVHTAQSSYTQN